MVLSPKGSFSRLHVSFISSLYSFFFLLFLFLNFFRYPYILLPNGRGTDGRMGRWRDTEDKMPRHLLGPERGVPFCPPPSNRRNQILQSLLQEPGVGVDISFLTFTDLELDTQQSPQAGCPTFRAGRSHLCIVLSCYLWGDLLQVR